MTTDGSVIRDFVSGGNGLGTAHVHDLLFDSKNRLFYTEFDLTESALTVMAY